MENITESTFSMSKDIVAIESVLFAKKYSILTNQNIRVPNYEEIFTTLKNRGFNVNESSHKIVWLSRGSRVLRTFEKIDNKNGGNIIDISPSQNRANAVYHLLSIVLNEEYNIPSKYVNNKLILNSNDIVAIEPNSLTCITSEKNYNQVCKAMTYEMNKLFRNVHISSHNAKWISANMIELPLCADIKTRNNGRVYALKISDDITKLEFTDVNNLMKCHMFSFLSKDEHEREKLHKITKKIFDDKLM